MITSVRKKIKNFPATVEEFQQKLDADDVLSGKVFDILSERHQSGAIKKLPETHHAFRDSLGLKKKRRWFTGIRNAYRKFRAWAGRDS